ncbi:MBL fold metallo-hydrolase [Chloroflexota bacterium]
MEITWLGHSCFRIKGKEVTLVTDPFGETIGYPTAKLTANIVTQSHNHPGHSNVSVFEDSPKILSRPGEYEIGGIFLTGIGAFHDSEQGTSRGKNTIYLIEMDDLRLCHLGDLGHVLSPRQIEDLGSIEVLFIPVGGVSTIDSKIAAEVVRFINPRVIIPMHYGTEVVPWLEPLDRFLKEMGLKEVVTQPKFNITRSNLPPETQVVALSLAV